MKKRGGAALTPFALLVRVKWYYLCLAVSFSGGLSRQFPPQGKTPESRKKILKHTLSRMKQPSEVSDFDSLLHGRHLDNDTHDQHWQRNPWAWNSPSAPAVGNAWAAKASCLLYSPCFSALQFLSLLPVRHCHDLKESVGFLIKKDFHFYNPFRFFICIFLDF